MQFLLDPNIHINNVRAFENDTNINVEIKRSGALDNYISVNLTTMNGTALG